MFRVAKREKNLTPMLEFARFFQGTMFASPPVTLTISSPETNSVCPEQRPGYLNRRLPTAVPTRSPAVLFLENRIIAGARFA
jgi:hypothetical protein